MCRTPAWLSIAQNKNAIVQPGVILELFQKEVENLNLFYPPDPTETNCTLGGTVANNSSGARTYKYGPTRNFVEAISVVLPNGEKISIERGKYIFDGLDANFSDDSAVLPNFSLPDYNMPDVKHAFG